MWLFAWLSHGCCMLSLPCNEDGAKTPVFSFYRENCIMELFLPTPVAMAAAVGSLSSWQGWEGSLEWATAIQGTVKSQSQS